MSVRVFVANDHEILRGALRSVIDMQPDMDVVGEAGTGPDAALGIKKTDPDVVLMDISVSNGGGLDAIAAVKRIRSQTRIVVLTFQEDLGYIRAAVRRRAHGYVVKRALNTELLMAIRGVAQGRTVAGAMFSRPASSPLECPGCRPAASAAITRGPSGHGRRGGRG